MKKFTKSFCFILCTFVLFSGIGIAIPTTSSYAAKKITLKVDGKKKSISPAAKTVSGKVYMPAKSFAKAIKAKYSYSAKKKLLTIKKGKTTDRKSVV